MRGILPGLRQPRCGDTILFGRKTYDSFAGAWPEREAAGADDSLKLISSETVETGVLNLVYAPAEPAGDASYQDPKVHLSQRQPWNPGPEDRLPLGRLSVSGEDDARSALLPAREAKAAALWPPRWRRVERFEAAVEEADHTVDVGQPASWECSTYASREASRRGLRARALER